MASESFPSHSPVRDHAYHRPDLWSKIVCSFNYVFASFMEFTWAQWYPSESVVWDLNRQWLFSTILHNTFLFYTRLLVARFTDRNLQHMLPWIIVLKNLNFHPYCVSGPLFFSTQPRCWLTTWALDLFPGGLSLHHPVPTDVHSYCLRGISQ